MQPLHPKSIVIIDFGGQYAHLIGNRVRRLGAFSEIREAETPAEELKDAAGIILSGGPQSVYEEGSPQADPAILQLGIPVLGLCYGLHWMTHVLGGEVKPGKVKEYGRTTIRIQNKESGIMKGLPERLTVWMSHGDEAAKLPPGCERIATSDACANAAFADEKRKLYALQFHPEVTHTEHGTDILKRFVSLCSPAPWSIDDFVTHMEEQIRTQTEGRNVFMLVSGGVDSTVAFTLLNKVLGKDRVYGMLVDHGLMRKEEIPMIREALGRIGFDNLHIEDASATFLGNLKNVYDPEEKRKIIGQTFLDVQRDVAKRLKLDGDQWLLGQGTIYPDTIETGGTKHADKIKTHHNRVEAIEKMIAEGKVIEPLKDLYKDEVRTLGELLGLPHELVWRHPFPGPGLGVRILCAKEACPIERAPNVTPSLSPRAKSRGEGRLRSEQSALLPIRSVGVQGDGRTYRHALTLFRSENSFAPTEEQWQLATDIPNSDRSINRVLLCLSHTSPVMLSPACHTEPVEVDKLVSTVPSPFTFTPSFITKERAELLREADAIVDEEMRSANLYEVIWQFPVVLLPIGLKEGGQSIVLRPVDSTEAMTANASHLPEETLQRITERLQKLKGIDLVFYDLSNKPPGTIEWE